MDITINDTQRQNTNSEYMPKYFIEQCKKIMLEFIWKKNPPKIKYKAIINTYEEGGLKLQDLACKIKYLKLQWLRCIDDKDDTSPFKTYLNSKFSDDVSLVQSLNFNFNEYPLFKDRFYDDMFAK